MSISYKVVSGALPYHDESGFAVDIVCKDETLSIEVTGGSFPIDEWIKVRAAINDAVAAYIKICPHMIEIEDAA